MAYKTVFVPNERFMEYKGIEIFYIYKDDNIENPMRSYIYGLSDDASDYDTSGKTFDVRDLKPHQDITNDPDYIKTVIMKAIDNGEFAELTGIETVE